MKINVTNPEPTFKPVTLSLTLESQAEVDAVYALFQTSLIDQSILEAFDIRLPNLQTGGLLITSNPMAICEKLHNVLKEHFRR